MGDAETITRNTGFLFAGEIISRALSMVFFVILARKLGVSDFGIYSFAFAIASIFLIFSDMGLATLTIKEIAKDKKKAYEYLSTTFSIKLFATLAFAIVVVLVFSNFALPEMAVAVSIVMLASFFNSITEPFRNIFLAFERHHYYALMNIFERVIATGLGIYLLLTGHGLLAVLWVFVVSYGLNFAASALIVWNRFTHFSVTLDFKKWLQLLKKSWAFLLSVLFMAIYYRIGIIMLKVMVKSNDPVGWYNSAYGLVDSLSFIPLILVTAVFPAMSRFHLEAKNFLALLYKKVFYYLAMVALPIAFATTILAGKIIGFLYTPEYSPAVMALQLLIWSEVFVFFNYLIGYLLNAVDKQKLFARATAIYLAINIALNLILIPKYQHIGVAAATILTQAVGFAVLLYYSSKNGYAINVFKLLLKPLIASLVMSAVILGLSDFSLFTLIALGAAAYLASLLLLRAIGREELTLLRKVIRL
ncbi:MAG: flippase [Candidatus Woesearchaeota archaeon]